MRRSWVKLITHLPTFWPTDILMYWPTGIPKKTNSHDASARRRGSKIKTKPFTFLLQIRQQKQYQHIIDNIKICLGFAKVFSYKKHHHSIKFFFFGLKKFLPLNYYLKYYFNCLLLGKETVRAKSFTFPCLSTT